MAMASSVHFLGQTKISSRRGERRARMAARIDGGAGRLARMGGDVRFKEPLSFYTSLRIGGPAEFFIVPQDLDDVRYALAFAALEGLPLMVLGGGNNVLFSDQTIHGIALKLGGSLSRAGFRG